MKSSWGTFRHYQQFIVVKVAANLQAEASRNYLSYLWWIFEPILQMLVFYLVFGKLLQRGTEDYVSFLLTGLIPWLWFAKSVSNSMGSIVQNKGLMMQVHLPKIILPTIVICQDAVKQTVVVVLLLLFLLFSGVQPTIYWCALPILLLTELIVIVACSYFVASIIPFLPDLRFLVSAALQAIMFASGTFYSMDMIPAQYREFFYLNPMANLLRNYRVILLHNQWPDWHALLVIAVVFTGIISAMWMVINRLDYIYPRVVL